MSKVLKKTRKSRLKSIIFLLIILYFGITFLKQTQLRRQLLVKKEEKESEVKILENDIALLKEEIDNSDSLEFVEKVARDELGMVKPREIIIIDEDKMKENTFRGYK